MNGIYGERSKVKSVTTGTLACFNETTNISTFELGDNYPNPFNPSTTISYILEKDSEVSVNIFDISGKLITTLQNAYQTQGEHSISWNGTDDSANKVGGGVYFYHLQAGDFIQTRKMVLLK